MTENTQTTAERMRDLIFASLTPAALHNPWSEEPGILAAQLAGEIDGLHSTIDRLQRELAEARAEVERLRPAAEAWRQVFEFQAKYSTYWRLNDETYWLARFMEEVGELAGALVGNHIGPVEWELSQLAAIALNWLDMRAARARAAKERKP